MPKHYLSKYFNLEKKSFIKFTPLYQTGVFQRRGCFALSKLTKNPGGQIVKSYLLIRCLTHHAVYNMNITGVIAFLNEMIIDRR